MKDIENRDCAGGLSVEQIRVELKQDKQRLYPVDGVSLRIPKAGIVGLVGESGCGKSMTAKAIMGLFPPGGRLAAGSIRLGGEEISAYSAKEMRKINGNRISMIFQEPMSSLNPVVRVGKQIGETLKLHTDLDGKARRQRVLEIMEQVGIPEVEKRYRSYPFELSGGLRQRIMIAMAMVCAPELLIADEPTTALDVTIEAQILRLMSELRAQKGTSILMITHNLGVVARICDSVNVMYMGQIVESCDTRTLFREPGHPYTLGLLHSLPSANGGKGKLKSIEGTVPQLSDVPEGCRFCGRCPYGDARCRAVNPELREVREGHFVRCHRAESADE